MTVRRQLLLVCIISAGLSSTSGQMMEMLLPVSIVMLQAFPPTVPVSVSPSIVVRTDPVLKKYFSGALIFVLVAGLCPTRPATGRLNAVAY